MSGARRSTLHVARFVVTRRRSGPAGRSGLTLIELMLALGLASIVFAALLGLLDTTLDLFARTERSRDLSEMASVTGGLLERDLAAITSDPRGDLVSDWTVLDADADGIAGLPVQRLRFVRHATPAELARLQTGRPLPLDGQGLVEVAWSLLPIGGGDRAPSERTECVLQRGVKPLRESCTAPSSRRSRRLDEQTSRSST